MSYKEFCTQYNIAVPFTTFYGLSNGIQKLNLPFDSDFMYNSRSISFLLVFLIICKNKKGSKDMYINQFIVIKWNKPKNLRNNGNYYLFFRLIKSCGKKSYHLFFHLTKDIQLRWFQCRILHLVLATNSLLFEIKIINTELCSFCSTHIEFFLTLTHLF